MGRGKADARPVLGVAPLEGNAYDEETLQIIQGKLRALYLQEAGLITHGASSPTAIPAELLLGDQADHPEFKHWLPLFEQMRNLGLLLQEKSYLKGLAVHLLKYEDALVQVNQGSALLASIVSVLEGSLQEATNDVSGASTRGVILELEDTYEEDPFVPSKKRWRVVVRPAFAPHHIIVPHHGLLLSPKERATDLRQVSIAPGKTFTFNIKTEGCVCKARVAKGTCRHAQIVEGLKALGIEAHEKMTGKLNPLEAAMYAEYKAESSARFGSGYGYGRRY